MGKLHSSISGYQAMPMLFGLCAAFSIAAAPQVHAMGYASVTCEELHEHKDKIYYDNGYCLEDSEAAAHGDKGKCVIKKLTEAPFSNEDRQNLMLIARNEEKKKCPRASVAPMEDPFK